MVRGSDLLSAIKAPGFADRLLGDLHVTLQVTVSEAGTIGASPGHPLILSGRLIRR